MKAIIIILVTVLPFAYSSARGMDDAPPSDQRQAELIRRNIDRSLTHDISQIRINTVQLIIDIKARFPEFDLSNTVIPLMHILKTSDREEFRILAAVALYHLRAETGRFAVSRRAAYDGSERVRRQCSRLSAWWDAAETGTQFLADGSK